MGAIVLLRNAVAAAIEAERVRVGTIFPYTKFVIEESHLPYTELRNPTFKDGKCWVVGQANDYTRNEIRGPGKVCKRITPIQVAFQIPALVTDIAALDRYVNLVEALETIVMRMSEGSIYQFLRIDSLKDENGTPFCYTALRAAGMFEAYFSAIYQSVAT